MKPQTNALRWLCWSLLTLAVGINFYALFSRDGFAFRLWMGDLNKRNSTLLISQSIDSFLLQDAPQTNVLLRFEGFGSNNNTSLSLAYYRTVYTLYPRRVFVTAPTNVINHGREILAHPFQPDDPWLDQHQVETILTFGQAPDGTLQFRSEKRGPTQ